MDTTKVISFPGQLAVYIPSNRSEVPYYRFGSEPCAKALTRKEAAQLIKGIRASFAKLEWERHA